MKAATLIFRVKPVFELISIHAAREGGDFLCDDNGEIIVISIHAAREGGDQGQPATVLPAPISIHAAREGGDGGNV